MSNENETVKSIVTSYRLKEDTKEKLQKQLKDLGLTQEQYFNKVVSVMELENVKQNNIFAVNATELQDLTQRIYNLFIGLCEQGNSFLSNKDVELEELKAKYKDMLLNKDNNITKLNQELQQVYDNITVIQNENEEHKNELNKIKIEHNKQSEQLESNLQDKLIIIEEYKGKNDMLLSDLAEYKQYKVEIEKLKVDLAAQQNKNSELNNTIKEITFKINNLNKDLKEKDADIDNLKVKQEEQLKQVKADHQKEIEQLKKENELNIKLAVAEVKEELNNKHNAEIEKHQEKYNLLLEKLAKIQNQNK